MTSAATNQALVCYLADPARAGVYRLEASRAEALSSSLSSASCEAAGLDWHHLVAPPRWRREALLDGLAASLAFPAYFGRNWDAAWDCLTELGWETGRARVLVVPAAPADDAAMAAFVTLMQDAAEHWAARGHGLVTLVVHAGEAPAVLASLPALPAAAMDGAEASMGPGYR